jgi:Double zinc ribbon
MLELIAGILLAAGAVCFVLRPIFRPELAGNETREPGDVGEGEDPDDDLSPRAVALRALKEIEFDRATGKLSDADYDVLKTRYTSEALAALRAERPGSEKRETGNVAAPPFPVSRVPFPVCPTHGPRPESDAAFCSECGRRLATAPGYCARCGAALEHDAHYCHSCGARVAA